MSTPGTSASDALREATPTGPDDGLSVGELAARSGLAISALHFYERRGLITAARTAGNQRRYPRATLRRVAVIRIAVRLGIPLAVVADALAQLPDGAVPTSADWQRLSTRWRADLDDRIDQLTRLRDDLGGCIGCGCLSLERCTLFNPDDNLGDRGPGAHTLDTHLRQDT